MCTDMNVPVDEIRSIISELSCNKTPGPDGLNAEHVKYADSRLKLSAQPYGQPNAKYVHFCTCTRYIMCT